MAEVRKDAYSTTFIRELNQIKLKRKIDTLEFYGDGKEQHKHVQLFVKCLHVKITCKSVY